MISTRSLELLPAIDRLRTRMQSMAMLDAILSPEWQYRYYSFNTKWSKGEMMGSMRDGVGNDLFALFNEAGCLIKGFDHESPMTPYRHPSHECWPGIVDDVPDDFESALNQPAFSPEDITFCIWRRYTDTQWQVGSIEFPAGDDPDGSVSLLSPYDGNPLTYKTWAEDYYETDIDLVAVQHIYDLKPLTQAIIQRLNPDLSLKDIAEDRREIGYPSRGKS